MSIQVFQANPDDGANIGAGRTPVWANTVAVTISGTYKPMVGMAAILPVSFPISSTAMVYSESPD